MAPKAATSLHPIARSNPEFLKSMQAEVRIANDYLLQSSKQGGFLAAAVIAASTIWMPEMITLTGRIAIVCLVISIMLSAVVHFWLGVIAMNLIYLGLRDPLHRKFKSPALSLKKSTPFWIGMAQAAFLLIGLGCSGVMLFINPL